MWKDFVLGDGTKEVKKVQINGKTVFERINEIPFSSSLAPTSWTQVTKNKEYTASNSYGTWEIITNSVSSSSYAVYLAFDGNASTEWRSADLGTSGTSYCRIDTPLLIKPINIHIIYTAHGTGSYIQGLNPDTNEWENLQVLTKSTSKIDTNYTITTDKFYSSFRTYSKPYSTGSRINHVYEFEITEGYYKTN